MNNTGRLQKYTNVLIIGVIGYFVLTTFKYFFIPIALAFLTSYLIFPIVGLFENKLKFKRLLAVLIAIFFLIIIAFGVSTFFISQFKVLIGDLPTIKIQIKQKIDFFQTLIETKTNLSIIEQNEFFKKTIKNIGESTDKILGYLIKSISNLITILLFIPIFSAFMLLYRDRWKNFLLKVAKEKNTKLTEILLEKISKITVKYMLGVLTVCAILATSHSIFLIVIGAKYPILIGILAGCVSIIPYFGTLLSMIIPLTFSILISPNPYEPIYIVAYWLAINSVDNNILTPTITGGNVNLNPLITILTLILGATLWGIAGMIVAIPFIGIIKIICDHVPGLEPYGYFLGIEKKKLSISELRKKALERKIKKNKP